MCTPAFVDELMLAAMDTLSAAAILAKVAEEIPATKIRRHVADRTLLMLIPMFIDGSLAYLLVGQHSTSQLQDQNLPAQPKSVRVRCNPDRPALNAMLIALFEPHAAPREATYVCHRDSRGALSTPEAHGACPVVRVKIRVLPAPAKIWNDVLMANRAE